MRDKNYKALVVEETECGFIRSIQSRNIDDLPAGQLLVRVAYSSLNYKDALSATGHKGITKNYPHTPGIDAAGIVEESQSPAFEPGDAVIVTGYDLGMNTEGGFAEYIRVPAIWAVKLPDGLSLREAMIFGTAGFTAGISVLKLSEHIRPEVGEIIVSGASGGVGSMSVAILAKLGYRVVALTGKEEEQAFFERLGAHRILSRQAFQEHTDRPLLPAQWAGCIDTVGGAVLENLIKSTAPQGVVTCCGNVASADLALTIYPFILRGVSLLGIDSQNYPMAQRVSLWEKLADAWKPGVLTGMCTQKTLDDLDECIDRMLAGKLKGRILVNMQQ